MPRRDWLLDDDGNRVLVAGDQGFAEGRQAVKQGIAVRVRLYKREYWLNNGIGVDWIDKVFARGTTAAVIKSEIAAAIADTPDVTRVQVTGYTFDPATRAAHATYEAASAEGLVSNTVTQGA